MKNYIIREFEENNKYQILSIEQIKQQLNDLNITNIIIQGNELLIISDETFSCLLNDNENPITLKKELNDNGILYINPEWYLENQELVNELIQYISKNINQKELSITNSILINDELINSICQNTNLKEISLARFDNNPYILTKEDYIKFKNSGIKKVYTNGVTKDLEENFDPLIIYNFKHKDLICGRTYNYLKKYPDVSIDRILSNDELNNLKYLNSNNYLNIFHDDYENIKLIIKRLKELNYSNKIVIKVKNKEKFNNYIFQNNLNYNNLYIKTNEMELSIKDYLNFEKQLYEMIEETRNLSPFEKYIYAYNKTKKFKKYKENKNDKDSSRNLYSILENKYMVCVGFSNLFGDLLTKLGIENTDLSIEVDVSYDDIDNFQEEISEEVKSVKFVGHARRYIHIVDEKYDINGFYIADPTWDNDLENDYYNHIALTEREVSTTRRYQGLYYNIIRNTILKELLNVNNIEEFYQKINFILDRKNSPFNNDLKKVINELIELSIKPLDFKYIESLKMKYPFIQEETSRWPSNINDLIYNLGQYIVLHSNKEISGETIITAVENVYKKCYGYTDEMWNEERKKILEVNKKRQEIKFPKRYKIDEYGNKEIIMNEKNKFDISESENKTL